MKKPLIAVTSVHKIRTDTQIGTSHKHKFKTMGEANKYYKFLRWLSEQAGDPACKEQVKRIATLDPSKIPKKTWDALFNEFGQELAKNENRFPRKKRKQP